MDNVQGSLQFKGYIINNISFILNDKYKPSSEPLNMDLSITSAVSIDNDDNPQGKVMLTIDVFQNAKKNNHPFELKVVMVGIFKNNNLDNDKFKSMLTLNGVATLIPFLRSAVADITKTANIQPLIIPMINVHSLNKNNNK